MKSSIAVYRHANSRQARGPVVFAYDGALLAYAPAVCMGLLLSLWLLPLPAILGIDLGINLPDGDALQEIVSQRAFVQDSWRWPLFVTQLLVPPTGVNIGMTDGIPLAALIAKLLRSVLPEGYYSVFTWLALALVLQPVGAVFALRSTGVRHGLPAFAVAVMSLSMPTLLWRHYHVPLCSHFILTIALGLYFRIVRGERWASPAGAVLGVLSLLVHPYIMAMCFAVLGAAPLTMALRRRLPLHEGAWFVTGCGAALLIAGALGYLGSPGAWGFGYYSMNLLAPFYPTSSYLLPDLGVLDATHRQWYEGYQYLGLGLGALLVAVLVCCARTTLHSTRHHAGLVIVCVLLTAFAASTRPSFGQHIITNPLAEPMFEVLFSPFRSSGRFFWPVTYVLLVGAAAVLWRKLPHRVAGPVLLVAAALQFADAQALREAVRTRHYDQPGEGLDVPLWRPIVGMHSSLTLWPAFGCSAGADWYQRPFLSLILLAVEARIPSNTMLLSRGDQPACSRDALRTPLQEGELRVFSSEAPAAAPYMIPGAAEFCRRIDALTACSTRLRDRSASSIQSM